MVRYSSWDHKEGTQLSDFTFFTYRSFLGIHKTCMNMPMYTHIPCIIVNHTTDSGGLWVDEQGNISPCFLLPTQLFHGSKSHFYILPALAKVTSSKRAGDHQNPRAWPHVAVCEVKCSLLPHIACSIVLSIHLLGTKDTHWQKSPLVEWIKSTVASSWCHIPPSEVASSWQAAGMLWNALECSGFQPQVVIHWGPAPWDWMVVIDETIALHISSCTMAGSISASHGGTDNGFLKQMLLLEEGKVHGLPSTAGAQLGTQARLQPHSCPGLQPCAGSQTCRSQQMKSCSPDAPCWGWDSLSSNVMLGSCWKPPPTATGLGLLQARKDARSSAS